MNNNTHNLALSSILGMVITIASSTQAETLNEVVQRTLATNPEVQASMQLRNAREQEIRIARSYYYPEVFISAGIQPRQPQ